MGKYFLSGLLGLIIGFFFGYLFIFYTPLFAKEKQEHYISPILIPRPTVIGFLPYWLVRTSDEDYSDDITTLTYFGLTVGADGSIVKLANEQEEEPGWAALRSDGLQKRLDIAKQKGLERSLLVFSGEGDAIDALISDPVLHANNLVNDVAPIMKKYGFTDLNLDIESIKPASVAARTSFVQFVRAVRQGLDKKQIPSLTVEVSGNDVIKPYLIDIKAVAPYVDHLVFMAYDYHYTGSSVTGAVAPLFGAGKVSEYDVQAAVEKILAVMPPEKLILGVPLYGYEWETLDPLPKSAIIPGTGITASSGRVEKLLQTCASCSASFDEVAREPYVIYKDTETGTYHQLFYPDQKAVNEKIKYAQTMNLGGLALWALGYEDHSMLQPLKSYAHF